MNRPNSLSALVLAFSVLAGSLVVGCSGAPGPEESSGEPAPAHVENGEVATQQASLTGPCTTSTSCDTNYCCTTTDCRFTTTVSCTPRVKVAK